ncbi:MAG: hypothetical protein CSA26_01140 [Desulfobacterales bacterium]|nr:MAG: hypothetical protein CSA26_01140 [Desulfobacterales bacterium]
MRNVILRFMGTALTVSCPDSLDTRILSCCREPAVNEVITDPVDLVITEGAPDQFTIRLKATAISESDEADRTSTTKWWSGDLLGEKIASFISDKPVFEAAAVRFGKSTLLIPGSADPGNHQFLSWLLTQGGEYLGNTLAAIDTATERAFYYSRLLPFDSGGDPRCPDLPGDEMQQMNSCRDSGLLDLDLNQFISEEKRRPAFIVFPQFSPGQSLHIKPLSPAKSGLKLMGCLLNGMAAGIDGLRAVASIAREIPGVELFYGAAEQFSQISKELLQFLLNHGFAPSELHRFFSPFQKEVELYGQTTINLDAVETKARPVPEPTPRGSKKKLTIGMATYDDFDGVYFTVQAIRLYHPEITLLTEILVVDNNPEGPCAETLKRLENSVENYRYIPYREHSGTAVRDVIFREAHADYVLSIDCHVLIVPGALKKLVEYMDRHKGTKDLLQGPLLEDNCKGISTHWISEWGMGMLGKWKTDERAADRDAVPFEIPMQGLGLFACRKDAWCGFNPRFRGFGGEEGYIHEKFRQAGGKTLCLPFLQWVHRFQRPMGIPYTVNWKDRIYNYMVGFDELGLETDEMRAHFSTHLGKDEAAQLFAEVSLEIESPFHYFDAIYCITEDRNSERWKKMKPRLQALGIESRVRLFSAVITPDNHHIGCALSHRTIIEQAKQQHLANVLVFEDDALFFDETVSCLKRSVKELKQKQWQLFYLGGHRWNQVFPLADQCCYLRRPTGLTCTHAIAYHERVYDRILADVPSDVEGVGEWIKMNNAIDQYLRKIEEKYLSEPVVSSQIQLLPQEKKEHRTRFTLGQE